MFLRRCLLSLLPLFFAWAALAQDRVSVYVVAHPDDWQLFMGNDAHAAIQDTNSRVVFILTTSGDASGKQRPKPNAHYARSRERGVLNSVRFSADMATTVDSVCQPRFVTVNGHKVFCYPYQHVRTYFLRLPDGCSSAGYRGQSLEYLHDGRIGQITAYDSSSTYEGWSDLVQTIRSIIAREKGTCPDVSLSYQDPDVQVNTNDHPDHRFSGLAAAQAGAALGVLQHTAYEDYCIAKKPANLSAEDVAIKAGLFALADFGITEQGNVSSFNRQHMAFLTRTYSRPVLVADSSGVPQTTGKRFAAQATLYPNPAAGSTVQVGYTLHAAGKVQLALADGTGATLWSAADVASVAGDNRQTVPLAGLLPGTYVLTLRTPLGTEQLKLVRL